MSRSDAYHVFAGVFKKQRSLIHCLFAFPLVENNTSGAQHSTQEWRSHKMESIRVSESQVRGKLSTNQEFLLVLLHEQEGKKSHYLKTSKCWVYYSTALIKPRYRLKKSIQIKNNLSKLMHGRFIFYL